MEVQNPAPQKCMFLKVMGIIMIVGGIASIIINIVALLGVGALVALAAYGGVEISTGLLVVSFILSILGSVVELLAGLQGNKNCDKPELADKCVKLGIAVIAISIIANVLTLIGYAESFSVLGLLTGLVVPVLYLVAAFQCKNMAK